MARIHTIVSASLLAGLFIAVGCGSTEDGSAFGGEGTSGGENGQGTSGSEQRDEPDERDEEPAPDHGDDGAPSGAASL